MESCAEWRYSFTYAWVNSFTSLFLDVNSVGRNHSDSMHNRPSLRGHCVRCHEVALEKPKGQGRQSKVTSKWELLLTKFTAAWVLEQKNSSSVQFSSVAQPCPTLCNPMNCSTPGLPVHHQLPELTQTHVHQVSDAIQPSHPLLSPFPPTPNPSQHQSLFQWVNSSHEVAKVLEFQLQHRSFQRTPRADLL